MAQSPNIDLYLPNRIDNVEVDTTLASNFTKIDAKIGDHTAQLTESANKINSIGINVKYPFGTGLTPAKGDNVTDDTAALQAIINYAYTNKIAIFFPKGIYKVTQSLIIHSNINIIGSSTLGVDVYDVSKYECAILSSADKVFVGDVAGTAASYFQTSVTMTGIMIMGNGKGKTLFEFMNLSASEISQCIIYNFDYVINGIVTNVSNIHHNRILNIYTSFLVSLGTANTTLTDSRIHHNYLNGTSEGNTIMINLGYGNYSDIHNNFFDYCYFGVKASPSSSLMDISNNLFDICFRGIQADAMTSSMISTNRFGKCSKSDYTLFTNLSAQKITDYSTLDWIGINLGDGCNRMTVSENVASKSNILVNITGYGYTNIKTGLNVNGYDTGKTIYMRRSLDTNNVNDGVNLEINEMDYKTVTTLPPSSIWWETFSGNKLYYQNKLIRLDGSTWRDAVGNIVT